MAKSASRAGGRATEAGMTFQIKVGTWFAAHLVSGLPVGERFGLAAKPIPVKLQFETGEFLDDIVVHQSNEGVIMLQCKTNPKLSASPSSDLCTTITQLVNLSVSLSHDDAKAEIPRDLSTVLAVSSSAPRSLDDLEDACRFFDHGGSWEDAKRELSQKRLRALECFETHARRAWFEAANGRSNGVGPCWACPHFSSCPLRRRHKRHGPTRSRANPWSETVRTGGKGQ